MQYQFDFSALLPYWSDFLSGALVTIEITVFSVIIGLVIGVACAKEPFGSPSPSGAAVWYSRNSKPSLSLKIPTT